MPNNDDKRLPHIKELSPWLAMSLMDDKIGQHYPIIERSVLDRKPSISRKSRMKLKKRKARRKLSRKSRKQ